MIVIDDVIRVEVDGPALLECCFWYAVALPHSVTATGPPRQIGDLVTKPEAVRSVCRRGSSTYEYDELECPARCRAGRAGNDG